jgi:hypothetical protein
MRNIKTNFQKFLRAAIPIAGLAAATSSAWAGAAEQVLYNFCSNRGIPLCSDGAGPTAGLFIDDGDGTLYGTALGRAWCSGFRRLAATRGSLNRGARRRWFPFLVLGPTGLIP